MRRVIDVEEEEKVMIEQDGLDMVLVMADYGLCGGCRLRFPAWIGVRFTAVFPYLFSSISSLLVVHCRFIVDLLYFIVSSLGSKIIMDPSSPKLPIEIVYHILEIASQSTHQTCAPISLVSYSARKLALPNLLDSVFLKDASAMTGFLRFIRKRSELGQHVYSVYINLPELQPEVAGSESKSYDKEIRDISLACPRLKSIVLPDMILPSNLNLRNVVRLGFNLRWRYPNSGPFPRFPQRLCLFLITLAPNLSGWRELTQVLLIFHFKNTMLAVEYILKPLRESYPWLLWIAIEDVKLPEIWYNEEGHPESIWRMAETQITA